MIIFPEHGSTPSTPTAAAAWLGAAPFTLAMSSGFFGFFAHCGFLWALEERGFLPARIRGSSAGALVGGLWAAGLPARDIARELLQLSRTDFWDPRPLAGAGLLRGQLFDALLRKMLPVQDFAQCRVRLHVSVFDVRSRRTRVVDGGDIASTLRASCAVPLMFQPVALDGRPHLDGGIADRSGVTLAPAGERIFYHHLVPNSFWRRKSAPSSQVPVRGNLAGWIVPDLPRVTPFHLPRGRIALEQARKYTHAALDAAAAAAPSPSAFASASGNLPRPRASGTTI
jgi:NTE family protein